MICLAFLIWERERKCVCVCEKVWEILVNTEFEWLQMQQDIKIENSNDEQIPQFLQDSNK